MKSKKLALFLTGCVFFYVNLGFADYRAIGEYSGIPHGGYSDSRIDVNTAVIKYDGDLFTSQKKIENFVLYRCAKVTVDAGFDYFIVTSVTSSPIYVNVKTKAIAQTYMTDPPRLFTAYPDSTESEESETLSSIKPCKGDNCRADLHGITAVIKMFRGEAREGQFRTYDAEDVLANLDPKG